MSIKITVVIPVFNEVEAMPSLIQKLDTILSSKYNDNFEVFIVDDGMILPLGENSSRNETINNTSRFTLKRENSTTNALVFKSIHPSLSIALISSNTSVSLSGKM